MVPDEKISIILMPITDLLLAGLNLMLVGMGIVFSFLVLLVLSMLGMSRFALASERQVAKPAQIVQPAPTVHPSDDVRGDLIAVISAAISRYRTTHN
ncbi:MAG: OadG family protein [Gammaproteobacteria bacterium]|nr:OadG family protein [Gammaproteobacteria bacterium]